MHNTPFMTDTAPDAAASEMAVNYFGTLKMSRAFASILAGSGGGALVNVLSVVSWFTNPMNGTYCASKAAARALTDGLRLELARQQTQVVGVYASFIDTDMAAAIDARKALPADIASKVLSGVEAGRDEILADERSEEIGRLLAQDRVGFYRTLPR
ncbi:hypothetical protein CY652_18040 [Burkholderia sp. WAC0059]|nr:hypothetical protein CY652_18040 [Burkholderia sp. WAC0059]